MKIQQLPDGRWFGTWRAGKQRRVHGTNRQQLEDQANKEIYEWKQRGITPDAFKKGSKVADVCDAYEADHVIDGEIRNKIAIQSAIRLFKRIFATNLNIRDLDKDTIKKALKKYLNETHVRLSDEIDAEGNRVKVKVQTSSSSVKKRFGQLRAILNWAKNKGYIRENPCESFEKEERWEEDDAFPRFLDHAEIKLLIKGVARRFFDYCFLILHTGMRPSEALRLAWTDVDLDSRLIYFVKRQRNAGGLRQKNNKKATVPIDPPLFKWFQRKLKESGGKGLVLNYTLQQLRDDSEAAIEASGINKVVKPGTSKFTIYGLRHTFASHLLMAGEKIETVAKILRHSDINITYKHYGHLVEKYKQEAMQKVNLLEETIDLKVVGE